MTKNKPLTTWNSIRDKARNSYKAKDPGSVSTLSHMLSIIDTAEKWEVDPSLLKDFKATNLRDIIREARIAIDIGDRDRLIELFTLAAELKNWELRLRVRDLHRDEILVHEIPGINIYAPLYRMDVTPAQLEKIKKATILQLSFKIKKD